MYYYSFLLHCFRLDENTVISIVDARVQYYVRHRHHKVLNNIPGTMTSNQSPVHNQERYNKRLMNSTNTFYDRLELYILDLTN